MPVIAAGIRGQTHLDDRITISGSITTGGTAQLLLPQQPRRLIMEVFNTGSGALALAVGPAYAHAILTGAAVSSITVDNGGLGYTLAPQVRILGGLVDGDYQNSPPHPAAAHAVMSGSGTNKAVSSIVIDDGGAGYVVAPLIYLENPLPALGGGAFTPSATVGAQIPAGGMAYQAGLLISTSAVAIWGATTGQTYTASVAGVV